MTLVYANDQCTIIQIGKIVNIINNYSLSLLDKEQLKSFCGATYYGARIVCDCGESRVHINQYSPIVGTFLTNGDLSNYNMIMNDSERWQPILYDMPLAVESPCGSHILIYDLNGKVKSIYCKK